MARNQTVRIPALLLLRLMSLPCATAVAMAIFVEYWERSVKFTQNAPPLSAAAATPPRLLFPEPTLPLPMCPSTQGWSGSRNSNPQLRAPGPPGPPQPCRTASSPSGKRPSQPRRRRRRKRPSWGQRPRRRAGCGGGGRPGPSSRRSGSGGRGRKTSTCQSSASPVTMRASRESARELQRSPGLRTNRSFWN